MISSYLTYQLHLWLTALLIYNHMECLCFPESTKFLILLPLHIYSPLVRTPFVSLMASYSTSKPRFQNHFPCETWRDFTGKFS